MGGRPQTENLHGEVCVRSPARMRAIAKTAGGLRRRHRRKNGDTLLTGVIPLYKFPFMATKTKQMFSLDKAVVIELRQKCKAIGLPLSTYVNNLLIEQLKSDEVLQSVVKRPGVMDALLNMVRSPAFIQGVAEQFGDKLAAQETEKAAEQLFATASIPAAVLGKSKRGRR